MTDLYEPDTEPQTLREILGETPMDFLEVESALDMPRLKTSMPDPPLGIHFGMDEETYHALPCGSNTHLRNFMGSPTIFWADSWLNPEKVEADRRAAEKADEDEKVHRVVGKAYHAMILEGPDAYKAKFYPAPDPAEYPNALRSSDEIKQALATRDIKPVTRIDIGEGKTRSALKADHVAQLCSADRTVEVWDDIVDRAKRIAGKRALISIADDHRIRLAARMIAQDPQLAKAFRGGYPEVVLIWRDPKTGVLMKCRIDYLKLRAVVDLKSFANRNNRSIRNAILRAIAEHHYSLQPAVYLQGVDEVRKLVRAHGVSAIHVHDADGSPQEEYEATKAFALKWASVQEPDKWLWVFQQKGDAPVTRGLYHPLSGTHHAIACNMVTDALRNFRKAAETYGNLPWLDLAEIDDIDEDEIPLWGLDI